MSALPPKADMCSATRNVRFGPKADIASCKGGASGVNPIPAYWAMGKTPRVEFRPKRITEGDWQIEAHYPSAEIRYITGLTSKADIDDWMAGSRKIAWLRSQGYAK